jgi:hypothetical protein
MHAMHAFASLPLRQRASSAARTALVTAAAVAVALASPAIAAAQLPGAPVLQNAFANPGVTVAANYADGDATTLIAGAVAWSPGTGRFQFSGGAGQLKVDDADFSAPAWGARVAVPLLSFANGRAGVAPFGGIGGASKDSVKLLQVPFGVGAGWRMGLGATRALSLYATGTYLWARTTVGEERVSDGRVRFAAAADVTVVRNLGLTLGYEAGAEADAGEAGPTGPVLGVGLSWAFR